MNIIITLLILGVIIVVHELGHFLTAKYFKMPVEEFSLGMGPSIFTYEGLETNYSIRAIPIGGFVNIKGMEVDSVVKNGFNSKSSLQRFIVLIAGVVMNFLLAYLIVLGSVFYTGEIKPSNEPVIGNIIPNSKSMDFLKKEDRIIEIDGIKIEKWDDINEINKNTKKEQYEFTLERKGETIKENIPLTYDKERDDYYIGILPEFVTTKYDFFQGIKASGTAYKNLFLNIINGFKQLVTGKVSAKEISGPVGIVKIVGSVSNQGIGILFWLTALLSINIGFFNLLPFPALDGGRILFIFLEILGIKVNKKLEEKLHMAGMMVLFSLIILITFNDIFNIFKK